MKTIFERHATRAIWALRTAAIVLALCLPVVSGCGSGKFFVPTCQETNSCGGGGGGTYSSYAYVANQTAQTLQLEPLPTAAFTSLPAGTSYSLGTPPSAVAATPNGKFLYLATSAGSVFLYTIGTNGALTMGNGGAYVASTLTPVWMTVDPTGNWLFLISQNITTLFEYQINTSTGTLTQMGQGTALTAGTPKQVYVTPNGQAVYVAVGTGGVDAFAFNSTTGALTKTGNSPPKNSSGVSDNALGGDNNSGFLFVGETGIGVRVFKIGASAALPEVSGSPFASPLGQSSIVVDKSNTYVYVASSSQSSITGYTLAATTGALTPLSSSPFSTGTGPSAMSLDSTGKYLLVTCFGGNPDLQVFSFDATTPGKLDSVTTASTATTTAGAISLAVVP